MLTELRADMILEDYNDQQQELLFRRDWNALASTLDLSNQSSITELKYALNQFHHYGWETTYDEIISLL